MKKIYFKNLKKTFLLLAVILISNLSMAKIDTVLVSDFNFNPSSLTINLGDSIAWVWVSGSHTTTSTSSIPSGASSWDEPISSSNTSFLYIPSDTGTYNYVCTPHAPNMAGSFRVQCVGTASADTVVACISYELNDSVYNQSGIYRQILTNAAGCDSTITLNLTINTVDTSITRLLNTLTANATSAAYQWLKCDSTFSDIPGETSQSYLIVQSGNYAVEITQNNCVDTSACTNYVVVGLVEDHTKNTLMLYPNPNSGQATLSIAPAVSNSTIRVFNDLGQKIWEEANFSGTEYLLNTSTYPEGFYIIEIIEGNKISRLKILKE